jgi:hypothetical protein
MIRRPTRLSWLIPITAAVLIFVGIWAVLIVGAAALLGSLPD